MKNMKITWGLLIGLCIGSQASVINAANTCVAPTFGRPQMGMPMGMTPAGMNPAMAQPYGPNMAGPRPAVGHGQMGPATPQGNPSWGMPNYPGMTGPQPYTRGMVPQVPGMLQQQGPGMTATQGPGMMPQATGMTMQGAPSGQIKCFKLNPDETSTPLDPQNAAAEQKELNAVSTCVATCQANSSSNLQPNNNGSSIPGGPQSANPQIQCYKVNPDGTFTPIDPLRAATEQGELNAVSTCVANCQANKGCAGANCSLTNAQQQPAATQQDSGVQIVYADTTGTTSLQQPTTPALPRHNKARGTTKKVKKVAGKKPTTHAQRKSSFDRSIDYLNNI